MSTTKAYNKIEEIVMNRVFALEAENNELKKELALATAKLEVYDRIASVHDSQRTIGFRTTDERG